MQAQQDTKVVLELKPCDFRELIETKKADYYAGTREWVFEAVRIWLNTQNRLFWLVGGAGTGKSVVSAMLFDAIGVKEHIVGWHFCRHDNASGSDLRVILESWAAMLTAHIPGFQVQDVAQALTSKTEDLFEKLIATPLKRITSLAKPALIVFDALDELPQHCLRPVLALLTDVFQTLPPFIRIFVTSRDEALITSHLNKFSPLALQVDELRNREDLRNYLVGVAQRHVKLEFSLTDMETKLEQEFGLASLSLQGKISELDNPIRKSQDTYDVVMQRFKSHPEYRSMCNITEIKAQDIYQVDVDFDVLYEDAKMAREQLLSMFASEWQVYKTVGRTVLQVPVHGRTLCSLIDRVIDPGLKERASAQRKIRDECGGNVREVKDLVRLTAECKSCGEMPRFVDWLKTQPNVEIVSLKNKYRNPSPLGYRDFNLSVRIKLPNLRSHVCEIQVNLQDMLAAKDMAHGYYETIREVLPRICETVGIDNERRPKFEASVMRLLENSILDSVVRELELKAGGLFLYASLVSQQLKEVKGLVDISTLLKQLPSGLNDIYQTNFTRMVWKRYGRVIAMIAAVREPLPATIVEQIVGIGFDEIAATLSVMFPIREHRFEVLHKSVVDWLQDELRPNQDYSLTRLDLAVAHQELAKHFLNYCRSYLRVPHEWDFESMSTECSFAFRHLIYHLSEARMIPEAQQLVLRFDWLLARCAQKEVVGLIADVERVAQNVANPSVRLVARTLRMSLVDLRSDWRYLPAHLVGRLIGSESSDGGVQLLLQAARAWIGPAGRRWWCPLQQTLEPAGGRSLFCFVQTADTWAVAWSEDGKCLATTENNNLHVWDIMEGTNFKLSHPVKDELRAVAWSPDGRRLFAGGTKSFRVWDLTSEKCIEVIYSPGTSFVMSMTVAWSLTGQLCCSYGEHIYFWEPVNGRDDYLPTETRQHGKGIKELSDQEDVYTVCWSPDGKRICSGGVTKNLCIWDIVTSKCVMILSGHEQSVWSVSWSSDGQSICSGSQDNTVRVWNVESKQCMNIFKGHINIVSSVAWSGNDLVCSGSWDKTVRGWDLASGVCLQTFSGHVQEVRSIACNNGRVCSSSRDKTVCGWDLSREKRVEKLVGHSQRVHSVLWSQHADGRVYTGSDDNAICVWNASSGICERMLSGHTSGVLTLSWSPDGRLCSASRDHTIRFWDPRTYECSQILSLMGELPRGATSHTLAWSYDGRLCSAGAGNDWSAFIWDLNTGNYVQKLVGTYNIILSVSWSHDATQICSGGVDKNIRVWDVATGECVRVLSNYGEDVYSVAWSGEGKICSSGRLSFLHDIVARVWDSATQTCLQTFTQLFDTRVWWNSDQHMCGVTPQGVSIWNVNTGEQVAVSCLTQADRVQLSGLFVPTLSSEPLSLPSWLISVCPTDCTQALAHSVQDFVSIHPLQLRGSEHAERRITDGVAIELKQSEAADTLTHDPLPSLTPFLEVSWELQRALSAQQNPQFQELVARWTENLRKTTRVLSLQTHDNCV